MHTQESESRIGGGKYGKFQRKSGKLLYHAVKDLGDSIGFLAGILGEVLPIWAVLFIGVVQNFVGYGLVWLIVAHKLPSSPLWVVVVFSA
ncbi:hypothetical protein HAX54_051424 [Datura stramonium]|uniref:Nodulin-like domain-containing protein n=1 Tax=Datura stramonium TaxID=4076 RepID=A0ABS8WMD4_DATST|nr:hypothetical protein [Datura stramonium]